jgi:hypothetical protein
MAPPHPAAVENVAGLVAPAAMASAPYRLCTVVTYSFDQTMTVSSSTGSVAAKDSLKPKEMQLQQGF